MFQIIFAIIIVMSLLFFLWDFVSPDKEGAQEVLFNAGVIIASVVTVGIVFVLTRFLVEYEMITKNLAYVLLSEAFILLLVRKVLSILIYRGILYLMSINNRIAVKLEPLFIVKNYDPTNSKNVSRSKGILRLYHAIVYIFCAFLTAFSSAFSGLTAFRVEYTLKVLEGLGRAVVGGMGQRVAFFLWLTLSLALLIVLIVFAYMMYRNRTMALKGQTTNMRDLTFYPVLLLILFVVSKVFTYFLVGMTLKMALLDVLFWVVILLIAVAVFWVIRLVALRRAARNP